MITIPKGNIQTLTSHINVLDVESYDFPIREIANALANIGRFGGQSREFYSVAQHCVLGSRWMNGNNSERFAFLMHDASEAYVADIPRPIKEQLDGFYEKAESTILAKIAERYHFDYPFAEIVKETDNRMLFTEKRDLFPAADWGWSAEPFSEKIIPWNPQVARQSFIDEFQKYRSL